MTRTIKSSSGTPITRPRNDSHFNYNNHHSHHSNPDSMKTRLNDSYQDNGLNHLSYSNNQTLHPVLPPSINGCFKSCCSIKNIVCFILALAVFLFFLIWIANVQSRVNVLEHKQESSEKLTCNVHLLSDYVRPEPNDDNLSAMAHGYITLEPNDKRICYNILTTNVTSEIKTIGLYGPLDTLDSETGELYYEFDLPATLPDPNQFVYCMSNVSNYIFEEFKSKTGFFHLSVFNEQNPPAEIMR